MTKKQFKIFKNEDRIPVNRNTRNNFEEGTFSFYITNFCAQVNSECDGIQSKVATMALNVFQLLANSVNLHETIGVDFT